MRLPAASPRLIQKRRLARKGQAVRLALDDLEAQPFDGRALATAVGRLQGETIGAGTQPPARVEGIRRIAALRVVRRPLQDLARPVELVWTAHAVLREEASRLEAQTALVFAVLL